MRAEPPPPRLAHSWLLGRERGQRARAVHALLAMGVYLICIVSVGTAVALGVADGRLAPWLVGYMLCGSVLIFALLRSQWTAHWADPSMAVGQVLFAISAQTFAYVVCGEARGLLLLLATLLPVFGAATLPPRTIATLGATSLASFGTMMFWLASTQPARHDPRIEWIHFCLSAVSIAVVTGVAARVSALRQRLRQQREELREALARVEELATRDALTGLVNRRHLLERLAAEAQRSERLGTPLALCLIDFDHFKRINDGHGHAVGDQVLVAFARQARAGLRAGDVLARWGGEEFLLMLPGTAADAALVVLARLRERQRAGDPVPGAADRGDGLPAGLRVTFSAGVAGHLTGADPQVTIARADAALYRAKAAGRDRAVLAAVPTDVPVESA